MAVAYDIVYKQYLFQSELSYVFFGVCELKGVVVVDI